ncbi:hypothetical protein Fmac_018473 [Flemingia macrophylla]|uniref:Transposase n=1 Tax=Flemingia macrophylla TaxID=520843 RepID=A0ABD1M533_9FABA
MCLMAHFIDNNWKLYKKIINFCQVTSHSGEIMAKSIELCLNSWGLHRILSFTVDNASSNDVGIQYLKKRLMSWNCLVLNGDYIHMRCCAHILNLIVKDGLKEIDNSILRIRAAVKYIRSSPSRLSKFKACVERENNEYKGLVCLDVETRWNSTYLMLQAALKHQQAFEELEMVDNKYVDELMKGKGVPTHEDWDYARSILPFLKFFYEVTLYLSGSSYVTANMYMLEAFGIRMKINEACNSMDISTRTMAEKVKRKYDKYWGNPESLNMLLLIAVVLDPRYKLIFVNWQISQVFNYDVATQLKGKLESCLKSLFEEYRHEMGEGLQGDSQSSGCSNDRYGYRQFLQSGECSNDRYGYHEFLQSSGPNKYELSKYLEESLESEDLNILTWWNLNSSRFPILGKIARDVLAIPVTTVASESTFSTG